MTPFRHENGWHGCSGPKGTARARGADASPTAGMGLTPVRLPGLAWSLLCPQPWRPGPAGVGSARNPPEPSRASLSGENGAREAPPTLLSARAVRPDL